MRTSANIFFELHAHLRYSLLLAPGHTSFSLHIKKIRIVNKLIDIEEIVGKPEAYFEAKNITDGCSECIALHGIIT